MLGLVRLAAPVTMVTGQLSHEEERAGRDNVHLCCRWAEPAETPNIPNRFMQEERCGPPEDS